MDRSTIRSTFLRNWRRWVLVIVVLCLLLPWVRDVGWASLLLADFVTGADPSLYKTLTGDPPVTSDTLSIAGKADVPFDLYHPPSGDPPHAALILTHGLAHLGCRDPRVPEHAQRFARAGYLVLAPDLQQMKHYRLSFRDVEAVVSCFQYLASRADVDGRRIGALAPSFGAGPVLIAMSRPEIRDTAAFAVVLGGYFDLARSLRYTLTGAYDAEGYQGRIDPIDNRRNRWKFLHGNVPLLPASPTRDLLESHAALRMAYPEAIDSTLSPRLAPGERALLELMANKDPARFDSLYALLPHSVAARVDSFSLAPYAARIRARVFIVHSDADTKVSFTEALALSRSLVGGPQPTVVIVSLFAHMNLAMEWDSISALLGQTVPDLFRLWSLSHDLMRLRR